MLWKLFLCAIVVNAVFCEDGYSEIEYVDPIISMLLNGDSKEFSVSSEESTEQPVVEDGVWKCGRCDGIDKSNPLYSEENDVTTNVRDEIAIQIAVAVDSMRCVTVDADKPGVVTRVSGSCQGDSVTLSVLLAKHFTVRVYGE